MISIDAFVLSNIRRKTTIQSPCGLSFDDHEWGIATDPDEERVIAIICLHCGCYPVEIMGLWTIRD